MCVCVCKRDSASFSSFPGSTLLLYALNCLALKLGGKILLIRRKKFLLLQVLDYFLHLQSTGYLLSSPLLTNYFFRSSRKEQDKDIEHLLNIKLFQDIWQKR